MSIEKHIEAAKLFATQHKSKKNEKKTEEVHSLPLEPEVREKREHEVSEHKRLEDVWGTFKITRNDDDYITKIEKLAEDVVIERTYTRDSDNFITEISTHLIIKRSL